MRYFIVILTLFVTSCSPAQTKHVGGACEGCEAIYEYGNKVLTSVDTLPLFNTAKEKIKISGIVYHKDGKTPAKDVIIYAYQTDEKGIYRTKDDSNGWERRHGFIRGWVKTDKTGNYTFYTFRPASYPNTTFEQHIHLTIKEPDKNEYYIDNINFTDDPNLTAKQRNKQKPRAGSGIVTLKKQGSISVAKRDIILGLNIPNY